MRLCCGIPRARSVYRGRQKWISRIAERSGRVEPEQKYRGVEMTKLRRLVWVTCTAAVTWALAGTLAAAAQTSPSTPDAPQPRPDKVAFRIDAQPIDGALKEFASQANLQLVYETGEVSPNIRSAHVAGAFTPEAALSRLLAHTNLDYKFINDRTVSIRSAGGDLQSAASRETESVPRDTQPRFAKSESTGLTDGTGEQSGAAVGVTTEHDPRDGARRRDIEEVVVTAQKREERLQDVPVPVTALSADSLVESNQFRLQDYYTEVPGLSVTPADFRGDPILTIRGIASGGAFTNPTVGIVIDDVPYGSSSGISGSSAVDIDPTELAQVEVLRGPQGTLYGVSSIGGLLKYVTIDPSTDRVSGNVQAGTSAVHSGTKPGYNVSGAVNLPLSNTWAIRASAFTRRDPGYIDNVETGQRGINEGKVGGGRLSALWRPSEEFSVKLSALYQDVKVYGSPQADPDLGDLKQGNVRGTGTYDKNTQAYSAIAKAKLGVVDVTALSGFSINKISDSYDLTAAFGSGPDSIPESFFGVAGALDHERLRTTKYTQEIRVSAPIGQRLEWLFGAFYTHESTPDVTTLLTADPATGVLAGALLDSDSFPTTYQEYAAFTDVTLHVTDQFDLQLGGRESQNRQTYHETIAGVAVPDFFGVPSPAIQPELETKDNSFTYLVTPQWKVSPDLMLYARMASGYRAGGPNTTASLLNIPPEYAPDTTRNYELGAKGNVLSHKLSFDASVYYIDWKDMQLQLAAPNGAYYYANASRSKSQGVELSVESRPLTGLKVAAWVAWNEAVLTKDIPLPTSPATFPPAYGVAGDRLPYSARFSGSLSLRDDFPLWGDATGFCAAAVSYVGDRKSIFTSTPERQDLPAYVKTDVRAGVRYESWSTNIFVDNLTDQRGVLSGGLGAINPLAFNYIQPRTVGLSVAKTF
jgi:iron complex outermembrane receptor protein